MIKHKDHFHGSDLEKIEQIYGIKKEEIVSFSANVNPLGVSPLLRTALSEQIDVITTYPDREYTSLRKCIAEYCGTEYENVIVGNGSTELISLFIQIEHPKKAMVIGPTYSEYEREISLGGGTTLYYPLREKDNFRLDVDDFISHLNESIDLIVICNPNNPTGNAFTVEEIEKIAKNIDCAFLVDEAYMEFYGQTAVRLLAKYPNMIIARTFSKAYGLASCRVGYMLADAKIVEMIDKSYMPYHMNVLSLVTADICYQMRQEFVPHIQIMISERKRMQEELKKLPGVKVFPSETNFILVHYDKAQELNALFESKGIGVRHFGDAPGLKDCLRIDAGQTLNAVAEGRA